jgi:hypothetical protein
MITGPMIAEIAALVGDPTRATILSALLDGRALPASELAFAARITPQTASSHLAKLTEAGPGVPHPIARVLEALTHPPRTGCAVVTPGTDLARPETIGGRHYPRPSPERKSGGATMIRRLSSGRYRLYSRKKDPRTGKRRNLGTFATRAAAERHERAVQFFKRR